MTSIQDTSPNQDAPAPATGLKAKANEVGLQLFMKAPPKAQNAILQGYTKAAPVAAKVKPLAKPLLAGAGAILAIRKVRHRKG
jgi:hypothetical protein